MLLSLRMLQPLSVVLMGRRDACPGGDRHNELRGLPVPVQPGRVDTAGDRRAGEAGNEEWRFPHNRLLAWCRPRKEGLEEMCGMYSSERADAENVLSVAPYPACRTGESLAPP